MEKDSIWSKVKTFIKENVFFRVPKEEKEYIRSTTMEQDHASIRRMMVIIIFVQVSMILYKILSCNFDFKQYDKFYLTCYLFLSVSLAIFFPLLDLLRRRKQTLPYFICVAIVIVLFFTWALFVTLIDSRYEANFTTFAYVVLGLTACITLDPWIYILDVICYGIALLIGVDLLPNAVLRSSTIVTSISIILIASIVSIATFSRRIKTMLLQKEITDLNKVLQVSADVDDLTKIYNRRFLTEHIDDNLNLGAIPSAVVMFDIDDFKQINDQFGHLSGDLILTALGELTKEFCNQFDGSYPVRFGGEEFMVYFPHVSQSSLIEKCEEFRKKVMDYPFLVKDGSKIHITVSLGAASATFGINYSALINNADECLYTSKNSGKNKTTVFEIKKNK